MLMLAALGWLIAAVAMTALWAWQRRARHAGIAAAVWPALVGALAVLYANLGDGEWVRRSAIAWMMGSWGARLAVQGLYTRAQPSRRLRGPTSLLVLSGAGGGGGGRVVAGAAGVAES